MTSGSVISGRDSRVPDPVVGELQPNEETI